MRRAALRPKAKQAVPQPLADREVLVLGIVSLWQAHYYFFDRESPEGGMEWLSSVMKIWESPIDNSVKAMTITNIVVRSQLILNDNRPDDTGKLRFIKSML
jgi:neurofibromin 1